MKRVVVALGAVGFLVLLVGCGSYLGNLRRDIDEPDPYSSSPTRGGQYTELGYLDEEDGQPGAGRGLASEYEGSASRSRSWVSPDQSEANRRDDLRGRLVEDEESGDWRSPDYASNPNLPPKDKLAYRSTRRATRNDFIDKEQGEGSLWAADGQSNFFFSKNRIRSVGDLVTIQVESGIVKDIATEVGRTLNEQERDDELELAQARIKAQTLGLPEPEVPGVSDQVAATQASPDRAPAGGNLTGQQKAGSTTDAATPIDIRKATAEDINVSKSLAIKSGDTIMAEIVERYPNGNYKVRGTKRVRYRNGFRLVQVLGIVKGSDITEEDTVASGKLYEYKLEAYR